MRVFAACALGLILTGCTSAYYSAWEKMGYHKRDILKERIGAARDEQKAAQEQFASALDRFRSVVQFSGGELQAKYDALAAELGKSETRAKGVRSRIDAVESVATALFQEWEGELGQYQNPELKRKSEEQLRDTRAKYDELQAKMRRAEARMEPVLAVFRDNVLFLKHNLNARAVASLGDVAVQLDKDVAALVDDMQRSIDEADDFIGGLQ